MSLRPILATLILTLLASLAAAAPAVRPHRPANYDDFVAVTDYPSVEEAIANESLLYFPSQAKAGRAWTVYEIDNPIVIDRDTPLVMHGIFAQVTLMPKNMEAPMFIIERTPYFNLERVRIDYDAWQDFDKPEEAYTNATAIRFANTEPLEADFQLVELRQASLQIAGPGRFILQRWSNRMHGLLHAGTMIDHPGAEVIITSGGSVNRPQPAVLDSPDVYWVWCKRGHLEIYGAFPAGFTRGRADIRIDTPSPKGTHIIAYSRSEGTKRRRGGAGDARSRLVYVPPSDLPVDIAMKACRGGLQEPECALVEYNAAGTLWLLANNALSTAHLRDTHPEVDDRRTFLVEGNAPDATVLAIGNLMTNRAPLSRINARTKIARANILPLSGWYRKLPAGDELETTDEWHQTIGDPAADLPPVPRSDPPILGCIPVGDSVPEALDLVSVKTFGAVGDGKTDDTAALQAAFDSDHVTQLFFPPGTYITTKPLDLRIAERFRAGGWIVGAGPEKSIIRNTAGGTVVNANGVIWGLFQGLAFETVDQSDICFHLDKVTGHTSGVLFDNCRFKGGKVAMGLAMDKGPNTEHIMHTDCVFEDADIGYASGNTNALKNLIARGTFRNNRINMAFRWRRDDWTDAGANGCWGILGATFTGTREQDFDFAMHKIRYFLNVTSDTPMITDDSAGSKFTDIQIFENCTWTNTAPVFYRNGTTGGPIFLYSQVATDGIERDAGRHGLGFVINLDSRIGGENWDDPIRLWGEDAPARTLP